jgi:hypothetical protein
MESRCFLPRVESLPRDSHSLDSLRRPLRRDVPAATAMHHIFANQKAVDGYSSGNFADGSIIVYELREARQQNGILFEGDRRRVDVMIRDSVRYKNTGGWRFERFMGNDQTEGVVHDSGESCFKCHTNAITHGFVISQMH